MLIDCVFVSVVLRLIGWLIGWRVCVGWFVCGIFADFGCVFGGFVVCLIRGVSVALWFGWF